MSSERDEAPTHQPEQRERQLSDPGLSDLSRDDYKAVVVRAGKQALAEWDGAAAEVQEQVREILGPDTELFHDLLRRLSSGLKADLPVES